MKSLIIANWPQYQFAFGEWYGIKKKIYEEVNYSQMEM